MYLDFAWVLLALAVVFALGWWASRVDLRQWKIENQRSPKAYFKGLNFLLNEQQDEAIDAFIEAVQKDPDTLELHFALGSLFRRRGEYERAVRVHEHLLARADLSPSDRERAQFALSQDFLKAGLLDRAEAALEQLKDTSHQEKAWLALLALSERAREWKKAIAIAQQLQNGGFGDLGARIAHYRCELATELAGRQEDIGGAQALLEQACADTPHAARPRIQLADLCMQRDDAPRAFQLLLQTCSMAPHAVPLVASELVRLGQITAQLPVAQAQLRTHYSASPSLDVADALVKCDLAAGASAGKAADGYLHHLQHERSLIAARKWLQTHPFDPPLAFQVVQQSIEAAAKPLARYRCAACGFETQGYFWQCPGCQAWESFSPRRIEEL